MEQNNYVDFARAHGYDVVFTGIGMAFITIGELKLTETKDVEIIMEELADIGAHIMIDTIRKGL